MSNASVRIIVVTVKVLVSVGVIVTAILSARVLWPTGWGTSLQALTGGVALIGLFWGWWE